MPAGFAPFAIDRNIAPGDNDPTIIPAGTVWHVAVSTAPSLHDWFDGPSGGVESHFYVRFDGTCEQYRSVFREADAQVAGNSWVNAGIRHGLVSIEFEGLGAGEWTDAQIETGKRITLWVHDRSEFPLVVCPGPTMPGVGYHSMFAAWNPNAHSCPGPQRIQQFQSVIVPWLASVGRPKHTRPNVDAITAAAAKGAHAHKASSPLGAWFRKILAQAKKRSTP